MAGTTAERITTGFGYESTAAEVVEGINLDGKQAIVTGGASGIGIETARALAGAGAAVTLAVRNTEQGDRAADDIRTTTGNDEVTVAPLELTNAASIGTFVAAWKEPLDILVNNAGVFFVPELTLTDRGQELHFETNHLGHFALAVGLQDALAAAGNARIVSLSSSGHLRSPVIFDDLNYSFRDYTPLGAYGQAMTAKILFGVEATGRWRDDGITANAVMPGGIRTNILRDASPEYVKGLGERLRGAGRDFKTPEQGAATSVLVAAHPALEGVGGRYFEDCNEADALTRRDPSVMGGVAVYALDPANAERLWDVSLDLIG